MQRGAGIVSSHIGDEGKACYREGLKFTAVENRSNGKKGSLLLLGFGKFEQELRLFRIEKEKTR